MRVAIYLSSVEGEGGRILARQLRGARRLIRSQKGWRLVRQYRDPFSIAREEQPGFQRMLRDAEKQRFDVLIFWSLDRLSREGPLRSLRLLVRLLDWGIHFRSIVEPDLDTCGPYGKTITSLIHTLAAQERNHLIRRTRIGLLRQQLNHKPGPRGRVGPGRPPAQVNLNELQALSNENLPADQIASALSVSKSTVARRLKELEHG